MFVELQTMDLAMHHGYCLCVFDSVSECSQSKLVYLHGNSCLHTVADVPVLIMLQHSSSSGPQQVPQRKPHKCLDNCDVSTL